jgi:site-specific recombinase XerD
MTLLAPTLQLFFTERMANQRQASPATITSYRNTFRLLLRFMQDRTGKAPSDLDWADLDAEAISAFLDHLETARRNSARSRNTRLAALRSLFRFAALRHPEHAELIQHVLAIPQKRFDKTIVSFLEPVETDALLAAPDHRRWEGRRDHALLVLAVQTGLRDDAAPQRRRRRGHRPMAWPRRQPLHHRLHARRHDHQGTRSGPHHTTHYQARPIPAAR